MRTYQNAGAKTIWRGDELKALIGGGVADVLDALALAVAAATVKNIEAAGLVDTGFMAKNVYVVTPRRSTYEQLPHDGAYRSQKTGQMVKRTKSLKVMPKDGGALVGNAASYYVYAELKAAMMYKALEEVRANPALLIKEAFKRRTGAGT